MTNIYFPNILKRKSPLVYLILAGVVIALSSNSNGRATQGNAGNTGAPGEQTCNQCHNGSAFNPVSASIQVFEVGTENAVAAYIAGQPYDVRVTINHGSGNPAAFGFQLTTLRSPSNQPLAGYSNLADNVKIKALTSGAQAGRTYVEHDGVTSNNEFNFRWTAPAAGTGTVKMYASGNAVNDNNQSSGDSGAGTVSVTLPEAQPLTFSSTTSNPTCFGGSNGSIVVSAITGVSPFSFVWSDGFVGATRSNLSAGNYTVTISDAIGQQADQQFSLVNPPAINTSINTTDADVPGGMGLIDVTTSGGTGNLTVSVNGNTVVDFPLEIAAGSYTVVVTDAAGCSDVQEVVVNAPAPLVADLTVNHISCFGLTDGSIVLNGISGATPPYTSSWSVEGDLTNLAQGVYSLTVTDAVGYALQFDVEIIEPAELLVVPTTTEIACAGQNASVQIAAVGGTLPYNGVGTFSLPAGNFAFTVSDANGCESSTIVDLLEPLPLELSIAVPELSCENSNGIIEIEVLGGTPPFSGDDNVSITSGGMYNVNVVDANGCVSSTVVNVPLIDGPSMVFEVIQPLCGDVCDGQILIDLVNATEPIAATWNNGSSTLSLSELCAGDYEVLIADGAGCQLQASYSIAAIPVIQASLTSTPILCNGDFSTVQLDISGGTPGYSTIWSNNSSDVSVQELSAGSYSVQITDANGCESATSIEISEPAALSVSNVEVVNIFVAQDVTPGSINVDVSGGTQPYMFEWSNGANSEDLLSIEEAGDYSLTVTDANGCVVLSDSFSVEIVLGVAENEIMEVRLYPNPVSDWLNVEANVTLRAYKVYNAFGELVNHGALNGNKSLLNLSDLATGVYTFQLISADGFRTIRIVKQ